MPGQSKQMPMVKNVRLNLNECEMDDQETVLKGHIQTKNNATAIPCNRLILNSRKQKWPRNVHLCDSTDGNAQYDNRKLIVTSTRNRNLHTQVCKANCSWSHQLCNILTSVVHISTAPKTAHPSKPLYSLHLKSCTSALVCSSMPSLVL
jgi:hypothetical protein